MRLAAPVTRFSTILLLAALLLAVSSLANGARAAFPAHILVLHSYHKGFERTDAMQAGIAGICDVADQGHELFVEYMDTLRMPLGPPDSLAALEYLHHLAAKYAGQEIDLVMVTDKWALEFLLAHREVLAPGLPVVFCGISSFTPALLRDQTNITGVTETPSFSETIEMALGLNPNVSRILFLGEDTVSGNANIELLERQTASLRGRVEITVHTERNIAVLERMLAEAGPQWAVLLAARPAENRRLLRPEAAMARLGNASPAPVYVVWQEFMGHGPVGGKVVSAYSQGEAAARLALRILGGESTDAIPVDPESANVFMADYGAMQRFAYSTNNLPKETIVLNRPVSFYEQHARLVWIYGGITLSLAGLAALLLVNTARRRAAEDALRASEQNYRAVVDGVEAGILLQDRSGRILTWNKAAAKIFGIEEAEALRHTSTSRVWPTIREDGSPFPGKDHPSQHTLRTGKPMRDVIMGVQGPDKTTWINIDTTPVFADKSPLPSAVAVVFTDMTERRKVQEALKESERRFKFLIEDFERIAVRGYDEERRVIFWNKASENLYGYTEQEALGQRIEDLIVPPDTRDEVIAAIEGWLKNGTRMPAGELMLRDKSGGDVPVYSSHVMYRTFSGRREMFCIDLDLSEIRRMQHDLVKAKEDAEAANKSKSQFLANMSHELRTPLNGILSNLQLLERTPLDSDQTEFAQTALNAGRQLTRLLGDILDLSRVEAGKLDLSMEPFRLHDLMSDVKQAFGSLSHGKGVNLEFDLDRAAPAMIEGDLFRLRQVLFNLVGNAIKFTDRGFVRITVHGLPSGQAEAARLLFVVEDSGIGIRPEMLQTILEPFTQAEGGITRRYGGAGLGLTISRKLVELMGGRMCLDSVPGEGTTIWFALSLHAAASLAAPEVSAPQKELPPARILVVEDEAMNRVALARMLETMGHVAVQASSGAQALEMAREHDFDCILMDIQMPDMDGVEAMQAIRAEYAKTGRSDVPVVALTAHAMAGDRERFLTAGMDGYVSKPIEREALTSVLHTVCASRSSSKE